MNRVRVAIVWHQHQPLYRDLWTGEVRMPWVRLHGVKDYHGMAKLIEEAGGAVRVTINLVPCLIEQIEDYTAGRAVDPHLALSEKPAEELTAAERERALDVLFLAHRDHLVRSRPRYGELLAMRRPGEISAAEASTRFTIPDLRDLQVWANLTWFHATILEEDGDLRALAEKGRGYTEEEKRFVLSRQREVVAEILPLHRRLAEAGLVELSTSPAYHPILPLLADVESARVAMPGTPLPEGRMPLANDVREHLRRAVGKMEEVFGVRPRGLWPSEGSVSPEILPLVAEAGFAWLASDGDVLASSEKEGPGEEGDPYRPWRLPTPEGDLAIVFRDHRLSDLVGFGYQRWPGEEAARDLVARLREIGREGHGSPLVTLVLDGENPWEYYPDGGVSFLRALYREMAGAGDLQAVRVGEAIAKTPPERAISRLHSGSWIDADFGVWIGHPEDIRAWEALYRVRRDHDRLGGDAPEADREMALRSLLAAEGSDYTWWYGDDRGSDQDAAFDDLYRTHLANVYRFLGHEPPGFLDRPLSGPCPPPTP